MPLSCQVHQVLHQAIVVRQQVHHYPMIGLAETSVLLLASKTCCNKPMRRLSRKDLARGLA